jgi:hypothetical protein
MSEKPITWRNLWNPAEDIFRRRGPALKRLCLYGHAVDGDLLIGAFGELLQIDDTLGARA